MPEEIKYFIGQEQNSEVIYIPVTIPDSNDYEKPNRLKSITSFTQSFPDAETLLPHLITPGFIPDAKKIRVYKKDVNEETGLAEIDELRGGMAFADTIPFFQPDAIRSYFSKHITDRDFLDAATAFFKKYFGLKKPLPEGLSYSQHQAFYADENNVPIWHSAYCELFIYRDFLDNKTGLKKATSKEIKKHQFAESAKTGDCRVALDRMIKSMLYDKPFELGEEPIDYEAFYDLAMFVYNYEQIHQLETAKEADKSVASRQSYRVPRRTQYSESGDADVRKLF